MKDLYKKPFVRLLLLCICLVLLETSSFLLVKLTPIKHIMLTDYYLENLPIVKEFIIFYYTWYFMLFIMPIVLYYKDKNTMKDYIMTYIVTIIISSVIFIIFPTEMVRPEFRGNDIFSFLVRIIYLFDTPTLNCFPSMHCTLCFLFIYYSLTSKNIKWYYCLLINIISLLIIASTILVKQHVIYDVFGALIVALLSIIIVKNTKIRNYSEKILNKFSL